MKPSLYKKLLLMMLFLSMSLIAVLVFLYYRTEKVLFNEFERQTAGLSKAIQAGLTDAMNSGLTDEKKLQGYLEKLNVKGVKEISVISASDRIISSTNPKMIGKWVTKSKKELIVKADLGEPVTGEGMKYNVMIPVIVGEKHMGYIDLTMDTEDFSVFLQTSVIRRVMAAAAIFLMGTVLAVILARRYIKPVEKIVEAANKVASGELDEELKTDRRDEIGDLSRSFNYMVGHLREERRLRERLRWAEHLAGIGQFSRSIAHEIKNPLNFISLSIDHMKEAYRPADEAQAGKFDSLLRNMKGEIHRVSRFAESFLEYGRPLELNLRKTAIDGLIDDVIELVSAKAKKDNIAIIKHRGPMPELIIDPEFIKACLYNIVINAFQAMPPGGGTITVSTKQSDSGFHIVVEDTGMGIGADKVDKVFDPFFTTKEKGLGLGLAFTKRVIEEHGGKVQFQSEEGRGSRITIALPVRKDNGFRKTL